MNEVACNYAVETSAVEMKLVFDCKECLQDANLKNNECMKGVLRALTDNFNADSVILSDYVELRYAGASTEMLRRLVKLLNEIENLAMRNPPKEYFGGVKGQGARDKRRGICQSCKSNPQNIFPGLRKQLLRDIEDAYMGMAAASRQAGELTTPECRPCIDTTEKAMVHLFGLMEDFRSFLYYEGFRVVI